MLWAQFQPKNDAEMVAMGVGAIIAALICGSIPISTGLAQRQPVLGVIGGVISGGVALFFGCCGGLPTALVFCGIITFVAQMAPPPMSPVRTAQPAYDDDYDDYARPFQLPNADGERPRHYTDRDRDRDHEEKYGFRPRRRPADRIDDGEPIE